MTTPYTRPELTQYETEKATNNTHTLIRKYGLSNLGTILHMLVLENMRLVKEINEHRAARDIEPLQTFEV